MPMPVSAYCFEADRQPTILNAVPVQASTSLGWFVRGSPCP
jgi:hypothetical protein